MTKKNRKGLQDMFRNGSLPTETAFTDLIDSMLNSMDDGFEKTSEEGWKISQLDDERLISFYQNMKTPGPIWFVNLNRATSNLHIGNVSNSHVLTLGNIVNADGREDTIRAGIGINKDEPECELDVAGTIASYGRAGRKGENAVPADGEWYDITEILTGCQAFEVVAGVGGHDADGKYALMHAFALCTYNSKNHISYHQAHYGSRCNRLELRWERASGEENFKYTLQLRVESPYGDDIWVKYHLTRLWQDIAMLESEKKPAREPVPVAKKKK